MRLGWIFTSTVIHETDALLSAIPEGIFRIPTQAGEVLSHL